MKLRITVEGKTYDVDVEIVGGASAAMPPPSAPRPVSPTASTPPVASSAADAPTVGDDKSLQSPIAGSVIQVNVAPGDQVSLNQVLLVMEAMKMETNIAAPMEGTIKAVHVRSGDTVRQGQPLLEFE